jgi:hypothetical protein
VNHAVTNTEHPGAAVLGSQPHSKSLYGVTAILNRGGIERFISEPLTVFTFH